MVTVLLTCCGNLVSPGMVKSLKGNGERDLKIVGVDMDDQGIGPHCVDQFYRVPPATHPEYVAAIFDICQQEGVDVVLPCDDNECLRLAECKAAFFEAGIKVVASDHAKLETAFNKISFHQFLQQNNVPVACFRVVQNSAELLQAVEELGFPRRKVVIKPAQGYGGRGVRILTEKPSAGAYYEKPGGLEISLSSLLEVWQGLERGNSLAPMLAMEYLPGPFYSVEVLSSHGVPLVIVPKRRLSGTPSQTLIGRVELNREVIEEADQICRAFGFDFVQNYEMKISEDGRPFPYDLNPRVAASIAFCTAAGANLIYFAVKMALGESIPPVQVKEGTRMIRFFQELYL